MKLAKILRINKPVTSILSVMISAVAMFGMINTPSFFWAWLGVWIVALLGIYIVGDAVNAWRMNFLPVAIMTALSLTGFISVLEHDTVIRWTIILSSIAVGALFGWGFALSDDTIGFKPYRRFVMMLSVFDVYAAMTFIFAITAFFSEQLFFYIGIFLGGILYASGAYYIWRLYIASSYAAGIWAMLLGLMSMELLWVVHLLPFSYGVLGLLTTWIWYLLQLMIRFHVSKKGIMWRKQAVFLSANALFLTLLLFFYVRWV